MSKIISIGTAVPAFLHRQADILPFMQQIYGLDAVGKRKLQFLFHHSGIESRHSVIADYSRPAKEWKFYPATENLEPFPSLEQRMQWYHRFAAPLSLEAIRRCLGTDMETGEITHLITVSCTGMSAPGLDLEIAELLGLPPTVFRTSVNFMGCYAAIHALKLADALVKGQPGSKALIVCTELCTLHFQKEATPDNMMSSLLFADGSAAALVTGDDHPGRGLHIDSFYSEIMVKGKTDMAWELSSTGFQMVLSGYVPELIEKDFSSLYDHALTRSGTERDSISHWCVHPGGKRILDAIQKSMAFSTGHLHPSYDILQRYGNMSSATILFVLQQIMNGLDYDHPNTVFGAAFGPGLTMETFLASSRI